MQQTVELLLHPFGFIDVDSLQPYSVRRRLASFISQAAAGSDSEVGAAGTIGLLSPQPWKELGHEQLLHILKLSTAAKEDSKEKALTPEGDDAVLALVQKVLTLWETASKSTDPQITCTQQVYRCEIAVMSRNRSEAETALQQVKTVLQFCQQQLLLQPQLHARVVEAEAYIILGQPARARASLQQAVEASANLPACDPIQQAEQTARAQLFLAELLLLDRQTDAAVAQAKDVSKVLGPTYKASELLARISVKQKDLSEAARHYEQVVFQSHVS